MSESGWPLYIPHVFAYLKIIIVLKVWVCIGFAVSHNARAEHNVLTALKIRVFLLPIG